MTGGICVCERLPHKPDCPANPGLCNVRHPDMNAFCGKPRGHKEHQHATRGYDVTWIDPGDMCTHCDGTGLRKR